MKASDLTCVVLMFGSIFLILLAIRLDLRDLRKVEWHQVYWLEHNHQACR
jgi:hypothetical protein